MQSNSVQYIKTQNLITPQNLQGFTDGQKLFVKVLANNGNGSFLVSAGGHRFSVKSDISLEAGQSFKGIIKSDASGVIKIIPSFERVILDGENSSLSALLQSNGLAGNAVFQGLVAFFQQSGLKLDFSIMNRAQAIASRFPGKEKAACEIAALLLSKGINPTDGEILDLLLLLTGGNGGEENSKSDGKTDFGSGDEREELLKPSEGTKNLSALIEENFKDGWLKVLGHKEGILGLVNQIKNGDKHWVFVPFESDGNGLLGKGMIRLLLDLPGKSIVKMSVNFDDGVKNRFFVLYYSGSKVKEIRFCSLPPLLTEKIDVEEKRLGELFRSGMNLDDSVPVTYSSSAFVEGFCSSSEEILVADLMA